MPCKRHVVARLRARLELLDVRLGGLTQDFQYFVKDTSVAGRITIDMARMQAMAGGTGTLVELEGAVSLCL